MTAIRPQREGLKGRPPPRACPDDFEVIFVEQGRDGCVDWYRAHKRMITRWMIEADQRRAKQKLPSLIEARAAFVRHQRNAGRWLTRSSSLVEVRKAQPPRLEAIRDRRQVSPTVARHAAQFLRVVRNGGFIVSMAPNGDWRVGTRLLSAAQLVDVASAKGFDATTAALHDHGG